MIFYFLIYLSFQVFYDHWAADTVTWKVIYYTFQFGWIAALAVREMLKGRYMEIYGIIALIMTIIALSFLSWINKDVETFAMMTSGPPAYLLSIITIALFVYYITLKTVRWNGLKKRG